MNLDYGEIGGYHGENFRPRCSATIEDALKSMEGVGKASVNYSRRKAHVEFDRKTVTLGRIMEAIRKAGLQAGKSSVRIGVKGMTCASSVSKIEGTLTAAPGVMSASVNLATREATVEYLPTETDLEAIGKAIESTGYRAAKAPEGETIEKEAEYCFDSEIGK